MNRSENLETVGKVAGVTLDVHNLEVAKQFWQVVLGTEIEYEDENWVAFARQDGCSGLSLQLVSEAKTAKNRAHMDIVLSDYSADLDRLSRLGATTITEHSISDRRWAVMTDPDGNEFCAIGLYE